MNELSLEVLQHIGLHLCPKDYQTLRICTRTALPLKQRIKLGTLLSSNEWKHQEIYESQNIDDLFQYDLEYLNDQDLYNLEKDAKFEFSWKFFSVTLVNFYCKILTFVLNRPPKWFRADRNGNCPIVIACMAGRLDLVDQLLAFRNVNPGANDQWALSIALSLGCDKVVKRLLEHPRVNPLDLDQCPLQEAAVLNHPAVAKVLLEDGRLVVERAAIIQACIHGSLEVLECFLSNYTLEDDDADLFLTGSVMFEIPEVVSYFLSLPNVHFRILHSDLLAMACAQGSTNIVQLLLDDPRVDPNVNNNQAIKIAAEHGHVEVVELLARDPRIFLRKPKIKSLIARASKHQTRAGCSTFPHLLE